MAQRSITAPSIYPHAPGTAHAIRFGDTVYTSGILPKIRTGAVAAGKDIVYQAELVFANLEAVLAAAGARLTEIARVNCYIDPAGSSRIDEVRRVRDRFYARGTQAGTEVPLTMAEPGALIAIEAIARCGDVKQPLVATTSPTPAGWADAVRVGDTLYVTGQYGRGETFLAQAQSVYDSLDAILKSAGVAWCDVVRVHQCAVRSDVSIDESRVARAPYLRNGEFLSTSVVCHPAELSGIRPPWQIVVDIEAALAPKIYGTAPNAWANPGGLHVIKSGHTGYFQAQMSRDVWGKTLFPDDAAAHAGQICRNLAEMMATTGISETDIVHARIFCKHQKDVPAVRSVFDRWMKNGVCARTELVANFFDPLAMVEIELTASV